METATVTIGDMRRYAARNGYDIAKYTVDKTGTLTLQTLVFTPEKGFLIEIRMLGQFADYRIAKSLDNVYILHSTYRLPHTLRKPKDKLSVVVGRKTRPSDVFGEAAIWTPEEI